jgi:diguanylate cyclase
MSGSTEQDHDIANQRGYARSMHDVDGLLLLLALLYLFVSRSGMAFPDAYLLTLGIYGTLVLALRYARIFQAAPDRQLIFQCSLMVAFITALSILAGGERGPLLNLYLLPVVSCSLTLGRFATIVQLLLVIVGRLIISIFENQHVVSLDYALSMTAELAPVFLVAFLTTRLAGDIHAARGRIRDLSNRDDLTGVDNMKSFNRRMRDEINRAAQRNSNFSVLKIDIDGLRVINGRFGHDTGNRVIVSVVHSLRRSTRPMDLIARYGGDEFVVYLANADRDVAQAVANRIRHNVFSTTIDFANNMRRIAVNIGIAVFPADGRELEPLMKVADKAIYAEKTPGNERTSGKHRT